MHTNYDPISKIEHSLIIQTVYTASIMPVSYVRPSATECKLYAGVLLSASRCIDFTAKSWRTGKQVQVSVVHSYNLLN